MKLPNHNASSWSDLSLIRSSSPMPHQNVTDHIEQILATFKEKASTFFGYQANQATDYSELAPFLNHNPNNIGDPYIDSNYSIHSRRMERAVVEFFAHLYHISDRAYWGYVTSGGTEANIYGIYIGRNLLESSHAISQVGASPQPYAYFSCDTHYSINNAMDIMRIPPCRIPSDEKGQIQVPALIEAILRNDPDLHPPLIIANIGTTFTGAYDYVEDITH